MLVEFLKEHQENILSSWIDQVLSTYPTEGANLLKKQKDRFANPIGYRVNNDLANIFDALLTDMDENRLGRALDGICRVRSVQEFSASNAVGFIFILKRIIRETLASKKADFAIQELLEFETKIDKVSLYAFDVYMGCREQVYMIKADEAKRRSEFLIKKLNRHPEDSGDNSEAL